MGKTEFKLEKHDFIELNKLLKLEGLVESGGMAKAVILEGEVKVNGEVELRIRRKLRKGDEVGFRSEEVLIK